MDIVGLIIQLVSGAIGGNVAGSVLKEKSLGTVGNSVAGAIGGGVLGSVLGLGGGGLDIGSILTQFIGGGVGGGALMAVAGIVKGMMSNR